MVSTWTWISRRREEEILEMELKHMNYILDAAKATLELVQSFKQRKSREVEEKYAQVKKLEREADNVKDEIIANLSTGTFHPIDREELLRVTLSADDIAAYLNSAARRILLLCRVDAEIPSHLIEPLEKIAGLALESIKLIIEAVSKARSDPKTAIQLAKKVEELEEEADEIRSNAEEDIIKWCNENPGEGTCIALYNVLASLEMSTDKCEDTADLLRSIAILSI